MKKLTWFMMLVAFAVGVNCFASTNVTEVVDEYTIKFTSAVPRTYDNMESLGYRKYQRQVVEGTLRIVYSADGSGRGTYVEVVDLVNKTHKVAGARITYKTVVGENLHIGYIGSNKTGKFTTPFLSFDIDADPSYNVGADEPDNALILKLSGYGTSKVMKWEGYSVRYIKTLTGTFAGELGCGCTAYGHKSCTRLAAWYGPTDETTDIAAVKGHTWRARWQRRYVRKASVDEE